MDVRWVSDGCQMDDRWESDGSQMGVIWVSDGHLNVVHRYFDPPRETIQHDLLRGLPSHMGVRWLSEGRRTGVG